MKNIFFTFFLALLGMQLSAQEGFKIGIQGGLPLGDYNDKVGVVLGFDVGHMWALGEVVDLGITAGYIYGFPEKFRAEVVSVDLPSIQFLPIAASIRFWLSNSVSLGIDVGQALGINDGNDGGLYYRPQIGFLFGTQTEINLSYTGISQDQGSWSTATLGILYTIPTGKSLR